MRGGKGNKTETNRLNKSATQELMLLNLGKKKKNHA